MSVRKKESFAQPCSTKDLVLTSAGCVAWELYGTLNRLWVIAISGPRRPMLSESPTPLMKEHLYSKLKELGMK
jgi:hypothetical protein